MTKTDNEALMPDLIYCGVSTQSWARNLPLMQNRKRQYIKYHHDRVLKAAKALDEDLLMEAINIIRQFICLYEGADPCTGPDIYKDGCDLEEKLKTRLGY